MFSPAQATIRVEVDGVSLDHIRIAAAEQIRGLLGVGWRVVSYDPLEVTVAEANEAGQIKRWKAVAVARAVRT